MAFVRWECNFDPFASPCLPKFEFIRLDDDVVENGAGFNYRTASYYHQNGVAYRDLDKLWGIRLLFVTEGQGRRFDIVPLVVSFPSLLILKLDVTDSKSSSSWLFGGI